MPSPSRPRKKIDFEKLASLLMRDIGALLPQWLPGGKPQGREYTCGNLRGESGQSLRVNLDTGKWADFAANVKGGDLISLYAAINGIKNGAAARQLAEKYIHDLKPVAKSTTTIKPPPDHGRDDLMPPPKGTRVPAFPILGLGSPVSRWAYRTSEGAILFFVCRYDLSDGKKQFRPWSFSKSQGWVAKYPRDPRPLYNLHLLAEHPTKPVLIVEGEKSADAAEKLLGTRYAVTTWPAGGNSWSKADWSPIYGRTVLIWPDSDEPGIKCANALAAHLHSNGCEVKLLTVQANGGWDAADALYEGYDFTRTVEWAKPLARVYEPPVNDPPPPEPAPMVPEVMPPEPPLPPPPEYSIRISMDDSTDICYSKHELWQRADLHTSNEGKTAVVNMSNVLKLIDFVPQLRGLCWYDEFYRTIMTEYRTDQVHQWSEADTLHLLSFLQNHCGIHRMTETCTQQAVIQYAHHNPKDVAIEWAESLEWDGVHRIDDFAVNYLGCDQSDYTLAVSRNLFLSAAARILKPGCKVDSMVILEGPQGSRKSTLLETLGGEFYGDCSSGFGTKDFYQQISDKLIVEVSELDMFRKSDVNTIKRVITTPTDLYRPPYGRVVEKFPRRCIFIGTTNQSDYLMDETGNRRFFPLVVKKINLDAVKQDRTQFFAEAVARVKAGEIWYEMPMELAEQEQSIRMMEADVWDDIIEDFLNSTLLKAQHGVTIRDVMIDALQFEPSRVTRPDSIRVGKCLRRLGWEPKVTREGGMTHRTFFPKEELEPTVAPVELNHSLLN